MTDLETRLSSALSETAHRNVPDSLTPPAFSVGELEPVSKARWLMPAVAAAVVVAVAVGVLIGIDRMHRTDPTPPASPVVLLPLVQGTFHTVGNVSLTQDQLQVAVQTVQARLTAAGLANASVRSEGSDRLVISGPLTSSQLAQLPGLLAVNALQFRPLMTETVEVSGGSAGRSTSPKLVDPWRGLGFTPPTSAAGLAALTPARRQAVLAILTGWDCRNVSVNKADSAVVGCDSAGTTRYLMGAAIVDAGQVANAAASAPGSTAGQLQWSVDVELKPAAQQSWADYTTKHNSAATPTSIENEVADVLDGRVIVASTIQSTITGTTQITGSFDETSAKSLAAALQRAPLSVGFTQ